MKGIALRHRIVTAFLVAAAVAGVAAQQKPAFEPPRLIVVLVVDQFRTDYIHRYGQHWTKGLRRLVDSSAWFPLAEYPYALTVTCAGHATISTGTVPSTHGMIGNGWYDRGQKKAVTCTEDQSLTSVPYGGRQGTEKHGPGFLRTATLSDELRLQSGKPTTVVGLSLKARSALTLAGHASPSTFAVWEEDDGTWATSTAYAAKPSSVVDAWATANPVRASYGQSWDRLLPVGSYLYADDLPGEPTNRVFPHRLVSKTGQPDNEFVSMWERSPMSDVALSSLAQHMVRELKMGQTPGGTDFLGISFSALDLVGHAFGPNSHEVQDVLARLDVTLEGLFATLDAVVGTDRYVVALSADHGVAPMPEQVAPVVGTGGRFTSGQVRTTIENTLTPLIGAGPHVLAASGANVYLHPGVLQRVLQTPGARDAVTEAVEALAGPGFVYWSDELRSRTPTSDRYLAAARLSFVPDRSGDLMVMPEPYWMSQSTGTTHGAPHPYDQRVPVLFAGAGITPGQYLVPASPADIAPTLAHLAGITLSRTDGRVLVQAIR